MVKIKKKICGPSLEEEKNRALHWVLERTIKIILSIFSCYFYFVVSVVCYDSTKMPLSVSTTLTLEPLDLTICKKFMKVT